MLKPDRQATDAESLKKLPGMAYRCRNDRQRTMEFVSEGSVDLTGYRPADLVMNRVVAFGRLIHPDDQEFVWKSIQGSLKEGAPFRLAYRIVTAAGEEKWVWEQGTGIQSAGGNSISVKGLITDINDRLSAYQALEKSVERRTRELSTLLEVSRSVSSTLELQPLLGMTLEQLRTVLDYSGATIFTLMGEELAVMAYRGPASQSDMLRLRFRLNEALAHQEVIARRTPCVISDIRSDEPLARAFQDSAGKQLETTFGYVRSWMGVPLIAKERTIGMLSLYHGKPDFYSSRDAQLALAFASEAAVAIENARLYAEARQKATEIETLYEENARLYEQEQERRREAEQRRMVAEGLRDILAIINTNRPLSEILDFVVAHAGRLLETDLVALYRRQDDGQPAIHATAKLSLEKERLAGHSLGLALMPERKLTRQPIAVPDISAAQLQALSSQGVDGCCRALLAVPLIVQGDIHGELEFYYRQPRDFSQEDVRLAAAFADQAALAIENARLRTQAEQAAVTAERNRLARDLHDAVTQTLFSASLIAEVLPRLWQRNPEEGRRRLEELRQLTRGALAEMRTLLLELRPTALMEANLGDLLRQLTEAIASRGHVPINLAIEGERTLPPDVQVALYRIAQEALNNVAKHSRATHASVLMRCSPEGIELEISDDGRGFDPESVAAEHLGLGIMRERAESVAATISVRSTPNHGTQVSVGWKDEAG